MDVLVELQEVRRDMLGKPLKGYHANASLFPREELAPWLATVRKCVGCGGPVEVTAAAAATMGDGPVKHPECLATEGSA
ncbi:MAG: hypothetical protein EPN91_02385 [Salinibacterium sp.]|nr:MAG: hypothetical protein EPN91_02385 [Salinibacterium sp.]